VPLEFPKNCKNIFNKKIENYTGPKPTLMICDVIKKKSEKKTLILTHTNALR
jgi:hypothetical protein